MSDQICTPKKRSNLLPIKKFIVWENAYTGSVRAEAIGEYCPNIVIAESEVHPTHVTLWDVISAPWSTSYLLHTRLMYPRAIYIQRCAVVKIK